MQVAGREDGKAGVAHILLGVLLDLPGWGSNGGGADGLGGEVEWRGGEGWCEGREQAGAAVQCVSWLPSQTLHAMPCQ